MNNTTHKLFMNMIFSRESLRRLAGLGIAAMITLSAILCPAYAASSSQPQVIFGFNKLSDQVELTEKVTNLGEEPLLSGGEIRFLENRATNAQQLSGVVKSADGRVVVIDGGQEADAEHLISTIREMGGVVDAWLVTHPQTDHVGGLYAVLKDHRQDIDIRGIYYHFFDQSWYDTVDPDEAGMVSVLREQLATVDPARLHDDIGAGTVIPLSEGMVITVLNSPVQSSDSYAVNSSGLMYDILIDGKHLVILGDMGREVGDRLMRGEAISGLKADFVQMSHHGQDGVSEGFYRMLEPTYCIWPTTEWIYHVEGTDTRLRTMLTKSWISGMNVAANFLTIGGDVIIR